MGLLNADNVLVSWRGLCFGQRIILTNWYTVVGDLNPLTTTAQDLANILNVIAPAGADDKTTRYLACLPPQYSLTEMRAQLISPQRSAYVPVAFAATPGTNANAATVANDSAAITIRTPFAGRNFRGTKHIGPIPDGASANGLLTPAFRVLLSNLGTALIEAITPAGAGGFLANVVYNQGTQVGTFTTNFLLGDQSRVIRRRTVGVGE